MENISRSQWAHNLKTNKQLEVIIFRLFEVSLNFFYYLEVVPPSV